MEELKDINDELSRQQQSIDEEANGLHFERQNQSENHFKTDEQLTKSKSSLNLNSDDWVCPVALALRRAGYDVPLRPSKSWLERDRMHQAFLRSKQGTRKEKSQ